MRLPYLLMLVASFVCLGADEKAAEERNAVPQPPKELKLLDRYVGNWTEEVLSKPAEWNPKETAMTTASSAKWTMGGRFLENRGTWKPDGIEFVHLLTYDEQAKEYRQWYFDARGSFPRSADSGRWDEEKKTLTFTGEQADGITSTSVTRFISADRHEWKFVIKDRDGKLLLDMQGTVTRKK